MSNDVFTTIGGSNGTGTLSGSAVALVTGADAASGIKDLICYNSAGVARNLTFHVVKAGKSFNDASDIVLAAAVPVASHAVFRLRDHTDPEIELALNDAIYGQQDTGTDVTYYILGA